MAKISITMEGDMHELIPVFTKLSELHNLNQLNNSSELGSNEEWNRERIFAVWKDLSKKAQAVLSVVARNDEKTWEEQLQEIGWTANQVGGALSSLGAQLRNHGLKGITYPLFDNKQSGFSLLPIWKKTVLELTAE